MIDTDSLRWSSRLPAGGEYVEEADDRLLQHNLQYAFVMQACKEVAPHGLLLGRVIAFDKDQLKLLRPPHDALQLVEDDIGACVRRRLHLAWHAVPPHLLRASGSGASRRLQLLQRPSIFIKRIIPDHCPLRQCRARSA